MMTPMKKLALAERKEYDAAKPEERKACGKAGIGAFIHMRHPDVMVNNVRHRCRLLAAGDAADIFWARVEDGMPLVTAVTLFAECARVWREKNGKGEGVTQDDVIRERLIRYDSEGHIRTTAAGKVYRASSTFGRSKRIASGEESAKKTPSGRHKTIVREAIAAWIASRLPKNDERAAAWAMEAMREVELLLTTFSNRFSNQPPDKSGLRNACDLLGIPRPVWGRPADQARARKNQRAALRKIHPDVIGDDSGVEAFQAINDAYEAIVAYNDSLGSRNGNGNGNGNGEKE
jgi:hypothetical protein